MEDRAELLGGESQVRLYLIDAGSARPKAALGIDATQDEVGIDRRLRSSLAFVAGEKEHSILADRASDRRSILVEPQRIESGRSEEIGRVDRAVAEILIHRTMQIVGSRFGDGIDGSAEV